LPWTESWFEPETSFVSVVTKNAEKFRETYPSERSRATENLHSDKHLCKGQGCQFYSAAAKAAEIVVVFPENSPRIKTTGVPYSLFIWLSRYTRSPQDWVSLVCPVRLL